MPFLCVSSQIRKTGATSHFISMQMLKGKVLTGWLRSWWSCLTTVVDLLAKTDQTRISYRIFDRNVSLLLISIYLPFDVLTWWLVSHEQINLSVVHSEPFLLTSFLKNLKIAALGKDIHRILYKIISLSYYNWWHSSQLLLLAINLRRLVYKAQILSANSCCFSLVGHYDMIDTMISG